MVLCNTFFNSNLSSCERKKSKTFCILRYLCFFSLRYYYNFYHHYHYFDVIISMICFYLKNDLLHMTKKTYFLSSIFQFIQLIPCTLQLTLPSEFFPRKIKHFKARIIPYCIWPVTYSPAACSSFRFPSSKASFFLSALSPLISNVLYAQCMLVLVLHEN